MHGQRTGSLCAMTAPRWRERGSPCRNSLSGQGEEGFTLVELMVVLAIIMLLAAILTPAVIGAMEGARRVKCASNLKTIGSGLGLYANNNKGGYPHVPLSGGGWGAAIGDSREVNPFAENGQDRNPSSCLWLLVRKEYCVREVFACPSARESAGRDRISPYWDFADGSRFSYALMNPYGNMKYFREGGSSVVLLAIRLR